MTRITYPHPLYIDKRTKSPHESINQRQARVGFCGGQKRFGYWIFLWRFEDDILKSLANKGLYVVLYMKTLNF
jgi:hypothetical protein